MFFSNFISQYLQQFEKTYSLADFLAYTCAYVWDSLEMNSKASKNLSKLNEPSITELWVRCVTGYLLQGVPLPIRLYHSPDEKSNGDDIEILLEVGRNQFVLFFCQAKRLYIDNELKNLNNAKYDQLGYKNPKQSASQLDFLLDYAKRQRGIPLYMLYNYTKQTPDTAFEKPELYGCTLLSADYLKKQSATKKLNQLGFQDLHLPGTSLISLSHFTTNATHFWGGLPTFRVYDYATALTLKRFFEIAPPLFPPQQNAVHPIDLNRSFASMASQESPHFNPRFKIVFLKQPINEPRNMTNFIL